MANWPSTTPTSRENKQVATQPITVNAPAVDPNASAEERWVAQQWRDVAASQLPTQHPLSLNRDSANVTDTNTYT
jgi:hypothetical protein